MTELFDQDIARRKREQKMDFFRAYPKQADFMALLKRERLFMAANQSGKSECGAFEMACHLTGLYPAGWTGMRFTTPIRAWAVGESNLVVRNVQQRKLCGEPGVIVDFGSGFIPKACFEGEPSNSRGVADAYDTIHVKHYTNGKFDGVSVLQFKSYEQGRAKFQADTIHVAWCDEEAPKDIYDEILTRLTGNGILYTTFTAMLGDTQLTDRFLSEDRPDCGVIEMDIRDPAITHFTPEEKAKRIAGYADHERETRMTGRPMRGSGSVFHTPEADIYHDRNPNDFFIGWPWLAACDFQHASGSATAHPFAYVAACYDIEGDVIYLTEAWKLQGGTIADHANRIRQSPYSGVRIAWPHDGQAKDVAEGSTIASFYKKAGLPMLATHSTFKTGGYDFESGIVEMQQRFSSGRLKVHRSLAEWFSEYKSYHRKEMKVVKLRDDLLSATRQLVMQIRSAKIIEAEPNKVWTARDFAMAGQRQRRQQQGNICKGIDDWNPITGEPD